MRILIITSCCLFIIVSLCFSNCKKSNTPAGDLILYNKPLSIIRENIQGKWKLVYGKGGIASATQYYPAIFWEFKNDNVRVLDSGNIVTDTTIKWIYDLGSYTNGDSTYILNFQNKLRYIYDYVVDQIFKDTLILHENASDAYFYRFVKSN